MYFIITSLDLINLGKHVFVIWINNLDLLITVLLFCNQWSDASEFDQVAREPMHLLSQHFF